MDKPEKLERITPALVDKMIRTEDAVARGQAELAKQELLRTEPPADDLAADPRYAGRDPVTGQLLDPAVAAASASAPMPVVGTGAGTGSPAEALPPPDQWMSAGGFMIIFGALILFLDAMDSELLILSWLGSLQKPLAIVLVVAGVGIIAARRVAGVPISRMWKNSESGKNRRKR